MNEDELLVKHTYPEAFVRVEKSWAGAEEFTVRDPRSRKYVGPTAFTAENAWKWAAERLRKAEEA